MIFLLRSFGSRLLLPPRGGEGGGGGGLSAGRKFAAASATLSLGPHRSDSRRGPLTLIRHAHSTSSRWRGEVTNAFPFPRAPAPRVLPINNVPNRHCEERSDEAIQNVAAGLDCFASLAMTNK